MSALHRQLIWASGAAALTILLFAPERTLATVTLLLILACPILMVVMMRDPRGNVQAGPEGDTTGTIPIDEPREDGTLRFER